MQVILRPEDDIPQDYLDPGIMIAGVDEAGRGPLAGPVVAAAVIMNSDDPVSGLNDSKKLSAARREELEIQIKHKALTWAVAEVGSARIDEINILNATFEAMNSALSMLAFAPSVILIDGNKTPANNKNMIAVIKGDQRIASISAASILAKVERDRIMLKLDGQYPQYGFARHKGYPTREHMMALEEHGPVQEHRVSYGPVNRCIQDIG